MKKTKGMTIEIQGYDQTQVNDFVTEQISRSLRETIDTTIRDQIAECIKERVDALTENRVKADIEALLDEGWQQTDGYGNPKGVKQTVRDRVRGCFDAADSYDRAPRVDRWIKEGVNQSLEKALAIEVKAAATRLREAFDEVLKAKFHDTLRNTLGIK